MPGKKGKKGKKSGGKKGKKGGKSKEPQMTAKEAILAYQIGVIEQKLEDVMYEIRGWDEKNRRHLDRNDKLKSEQELLIKHLLKQARDAGKMFDEEDIKAREDVINSMKEKWQRQREREKDIEEVKAEIGQCEVEVSHVQKEVASWINYKDRGQYEHQKQIKVLDLEISDLEESFQVMKGHLTGSLNKAKDEIQLYTDETLDKQKYLASEKAIGQLDKYSRQEVLDNDWLRREVEIHKSDTEALRQEVEALEKGNLEIMSELFECKIEDLKISRNFYLTQFADRENLDETGILEMDLAQLSIGQDERPPAILDTTDYSTDQGQEPSTDRSSQVVRVRPQSAIQRAVEDKVFSMVSASLQSPSDEESDDDQSEDTDLLDNMFFEEEDFSEYLRLGPLELKLLNVTGNSMPIHHPLQPTDAELEAKKCNPDQWPVTQPMLREAVDIPILT